MEQKRFVRNEMALVRRFAAFLSELLFLKDDLKRLEYIKDGKERLDSLINSSAELLKDILDTTIDSQKLQIRNSFEDYRIDIVPKLKPGSPNILMTKDQAKRLIELAQERCVSCVEDAEHAKNCPVYKIMEVTALPDNYDSLSCPFSRAEWAD